MKITKRQLRRIIKEEKANLVNETRSSALMQSKIAYHEMKMSDAIEEAMADLGEDYVLEFLRDLISDELLRVMK